MQTTGGPLEPGHLFFPSLPPWSTGASGCCSTSDSFWALWRSSQNWLPTTVASSPRSTWASVSGLWLPMSKYTAGKPDGLSKAWPAAAFGGWVTEVLEFLLWGLQAGRKWLASLAQKPVNTHSDPISWVWLCKGRMFLFRKRLTFLFFSGGNSSGIWEVELFVIHYTTIDIFASVIN